MSFTGSVTLLLRIAVCSFLRVIPSGFALVLLLLCRAPALVYWATFCWEGYTLYLS